MKYFTGPLVPKYQDFLNFFLIADLLEWVKFDSKFIGTGDGTSYYFVLFRLFSLMND